MPALQETKLACDYSIERALKLSMHQYEVRVSNAVFSSAGCFMFLKNTPPLTNLNVVTVEGRFILCDFALFSSEFRVISFYAPNDVPRIKFHFRNC